MNPENIVIELIRKRRLRVSCVKPTLIVIAGLNLGTFRPLTLTFRPIKSHQTIEQIFRHYLSVVTSPVLFSIKNNCLYSHQYFSQIANDYRRTLFDRTSISFIESKKGVNAGWKTPVNEVTNHKRPRFTEHNVKDWSLSNYSTERSKPVIRLLSFNSELPIEQQNALAYPTGHASRNKTKQDRLGKGSIKKDKGRDYHALNHEQQLAGNKQRGVNELHKTATRNKCINRTFESIVRYKNSHTNLEASVSPSTELYHSQPNKKSFTQSGKVNKTTFFEAAEELYLTHHKHAFATKNHDPMKVDTSQIERTLPTRIGFYQPKNKTQTYNVSAQSAGRSNNVRQNMEIDIDRLTQTVMERMSKTIRIERQRRGLL